MHLLAHLLGLDNASGGWYLWWSGFFGDIAIFGAATVFIRHRNCHVHHCWRIGRHPVQGTGHVVCRRHHPAGAPTHRDLKAGHR